MRCEICRFWLRAPADDAPSRGKCRRYPPAGPTEIGCVGFARFPYVDAFWWCGEYQQAGAPALRHERTRVAQTTTNS